MSSGTRDVVVIGGGQNGLAAAVRLAGTGRKVVVVEARETVGGLCGAVEVHPGYRVPGILHDEGLVEPSVVSRLGLANHGLELRDPPATLLAEPGGPGILVHRDPSRTADDLRSRSSGDVEAYAAYRAFFDEIAPLRRRIVTSPPPPLSPDAAGEYWEVARHVLGLWRLGRETTLELVRVAPMCVADFLNERFDSPLLVEGLAAPAVLGTWSGPWSAGTTTNLLLAEAAPGRHVAGGPAALVAALERAAEAAGVEIRTGAGVGRIRLEGGRVAGVALKTGEEIDAPVVLSTVDPKGTLLGLLPPASLPVALEDEARTVRTRGTAAKVHLAIDGPFETASRPGETHESIRIGGGNVDELERAFDAVKYRLMSNRPWLDVRVPSVADPSLAPGGHHVVSVLAGFTPYELDGGWSEKHRDELLGSVLGILEEQVPDLRSRLVASDVVTPVDLESEYGLTGGQVHHGEPALDQLFVLRPSASTARYATPVPGLFLGGSGSHGGGGVTCTAGALAAEAVLAS